MIICYYFSGGRGGVNQARGGGRGGGNFSGGGGSGGYRGGRSGGGGYRGRGSVGVGYVGGGWSDNEDATNNFGQNRPGNHYNQKPRAEDYFQSLSQQPQQSGGFEKRGSYVENRRDEAKRGRVQGGWNQGNSNYQSGGYSRGRGRHF